MSFKYLTSSFSKSKYFFILLEKIKSLSSGSTESKPILNLAFTLEDNKVRTSFELKKLINRSNSYEINSKESFPFRFP